jgi:hypothetical protein
MLTVEQSPRVWPTKQSRLALLLTCHPLGQLQGPAGADPGPDPAIPRNWPDCNNKYPVSKRHPRVPNHDVTNVGLLRVRS